VQDLTMDYAAEWAAPEPATIHRILAIAGRIGGDIADTLTTIATAGAYCLGVTLTAWAGPSVLGTWPGRFAVAFAAGITLAASITAMWHQRRLRALGE
jgi:hypothetical protein